MVETIDWEAYYENEVAISDFDPRTDAFEIHRCLAAWLAFPRGEMLDSMLDVGCGDGYFCHWIRSRGNVTRVAGIDISAGRVARAKSRYTGVEYVQGKIYELPFGNGEFEIVTCIEVLEHLEDPGAALREIARVSRKYAVVTVPYRGLVQHALCPHCLKTFPASGHLQSFDRDSLAQMLEAAGLSVRDMRLYHQAPYAEANPILKYLGKSMKRVKLFLFREKYGQLLACRAVKTA